MKWHVFNMDHYFSAHASYREAVLEAQTHLDTNNRPKRLHAGFYTVYGENSERDVATTKAAALQGFPWAEDMLLGQGTDSSCAMHRKKYSRLPNGVKFCAECRADQHLNK